MSKIRTCVVLDVRYGPNLVFLSHCPRTNSHIKSGNIPVVTDANGRTLNIVGTTTLFVRLVSYVVKVDFYKCEKLAKP